MQQRPDGESFTADQPGEQVRGTGDGFQLDIALTAAGHCHETRQFQGRAYDLEAVGSGQVSRDIYVDSDDADEVTPGREVQSGSDGGDTDGGLASDWGGTRQKPGQPHRQKGAITRLFWDKVVNHAYGLKTHMDCLVQAMGEAGYRLEEAKPAKGMVIKVLPYLKRAITKAGGDENRVDYKCLVNKFCRMQKANQLEAASPGAAAALSGRKRKPDQPAPQEQKRRIAEKPLGSSGVVAAGALVARRPSSASSGPGATEATAAATLGKLTAAATMAKVPTGAAAAVTLAAAVMTEQTVAAETLLTAAASRPIPPAHVPPTQRTASQGQARGHTTSSGGELVPPSSSLTGGQDQDPQLVSQDRKPWVGNSLEQTTDNTGTGTRFSDAAVADRRSPTPGQVLQKCGMNDKSMKSIAISIALLDPRFLKPLAAEKEKMARVAAAAEEEAARERAEAAAAEQSLEEAKRRYLLALKDVEEFARKAQSDLSDSAVFDAAAAEGIRSNWHAAETEYISCSASLATRISSAQATAARAKDIQVIVCNLEGSYQNISRSLEQLAAKLGGDALITQLPDLVGWAIEFMKRVPVDEQWAAAAEAARSDLRLKEDVRLLKEPLRRLMTLSHQGNKIAHAFAQQITEFMLQAMDCAL